MARVFRWGVVCRKWTPQTPQILAGKQRTSAVCIIRVRNIQPQRIQESRQMDNTRTMKVGIIYSRICKAGTFKKEILIRGRIDGVYSN